MHRVKFNDYAELLSDDLNNNNAYLYNGLITTISDFIAANDCVSGLEVTAQAVPDMTVYVKSGRIYQNGYQGLLEADLTTSLTIAPASASQPRIDLICAKYEEVEDEPEIRNVLTDVVSRNVSQVEVKTRIASSIAFQVVGGTAAAEPTVPTTPEGWVALAKVTVPANASVIQQSNIVDMRPKIINIYQHDHSGGANGAKLDYNNLNNLPNLSDFTGATSGVAGKRGMVPAPGKNQQNALLGGDGLWHGIATIEEIDAGINDNKIISAKALKNARPLKTYTDWGQLNLNENNTLNDLISALPNGSLFINFVLNLNYQSMGLPARGYLLVSKENGNYFVLLREHYSSDGHLWFYTTDNGGTWKRIATANEIHAIATSEQLQAGIDNTTIVTPAGLTVARPLKTYTNWDQLGFTVNDGIDIKDVCDALPADSMFVCIVWDGDVDKITNLPIKSKGKLFIYKTGKESTLYFITQTRKMYCGWATTEFYDWINTLPTGTILPFAGGTIPNGFLACNGASVSRTTYAELFSAIGTTYGSGDGSTTFNLPLAEDNRFLEFASTAGTKKNAGLPNITGGPRSTGIGGTVDSNIMWSGALGTQVVNQNTNSRDGGSSPYYGSIQTTIDASKSSSIYGGSTTVQPKSLTVRAIIKY